MIEKAYKIAMEAFDGKVDRAGEPYIFHLSRVANSFADNEYLYTVAILHDLFEDCPEWNFDRLLTEFPAIVCIAVQALTKEKGENYDSYICRVASNDAARAVKLADLRDNMNLCRLKKELTDSDLTRVKKYHKAYLYLLKF